LASFLAFFASFLAFLASFLAAFRSFFACNHGVATDDTSGFNLIPLPHKSCR
jgi:hypothetical protein